MEENIKKDRAWIEIDFNNLENNIEQIKNVIPETTKIMAVIKANAYGHGIIEIAKKLSEKGIEDFAVATLSEGIKLRQNNIKGNILILGYTHISDIDYVIKYDLMQTVVDYEYAKKLNEINLENKIKVHIKINTGMNRIGETHINIENLVKIYQMKNLNILGTFSHLSASDSLESDDIEFTENQINNFFSCIDKIKSLGYDTGKVHIQASYGILNYPNLKCDYVRAGIIMYGVYSNYNDKTKTEINLKPVLTLKARISSVKQINKGDAVSYGRTFIADDYRKVATVCIGYADGYPRSLSNKNAKVFINGEYAEIIGRVCMDQLVIDVSNIDDVNQGNIVTLIGDKEEISAEFIANKAESITNELLCRLGDRLEKIKS